MNNSKAKNKVRIAIISLIILLAIAVFAAVGFANFNSIAHAAVRQVYNTG